MQCGRGKVINCVCSGINEIKKTSYSIAEIAEVCFKDISMDSLEFIKLIVYIEKNIGVDFPDEALLFEDGCYINEFVDSICRYSEGECYYEKIGDV